MHELPGHVTRPSALQAAANVTFKNGGHASVAPIKMRNEDNEASLDAIRGMCSVDHLRSGV